MDGSAVLRSAAGRACFESAFPVLHSGIFWADCCADSNHREVSFHLSFLLLVLVSFAVPVSLYSVAVGAVVLDGFWFSWYYWILFGLFTWLSW